MSSLLKTFVRLAVVSFPLVASAKTPAFSEAETLMPVITVRVHNRAPQAASLLPRATHVASQIFAKTGLTIAWLDCPGGQPVKDPACHAAPGPTEIQLRILPASCKEESRNSLGFALPVPGKGFGVHAAVFHRAVARQARQGPVSSAHLLGYVIAHEIGHLLLGGNSHSARGLMAAHWRHRDLLLVGRRELHFTSPESQRIREEVCRRMRAEITNQASPFVALQQNFLP